MVENDLGNCRKEKGFERDFSFSSSWSYRLFIIVRNLCEESKWLTEKYLHAIETMKIKFSYKNTTLMWRNQILSTGIYLFYVN